MLMESTCCKTIGGTSCDRLKNAKGPHIYINSLMNRDHRQLDVLYLSTLIRLLVQDHNIHVHVGPLFLAYS